MKKDSSSFGKLRTQNDIAKNMDLKTPIKDLNDRVYKMYAKRLEKLSIIKLEDFLYHFPARYNDFSVISKISQVQEGETVTVQGKVTEIKNEYTKRHKTLQRAKIKDPTGEISALWFNQPFLVKNIAKEDLISISGKVKRSAGKLMMESPDYEIVAQDYAEPFDFAQGKHTEPNIRTIHTGRLVPIYPETRGVSSKWLRRQINKLLQYHAQNLLEYIPDSVLKEHGFIAFDKAIEQVHFPDNVNLSEQSRQRLAFDELFLIQLSSLIKRKEWEKQTVGNRFSVSQYRDKIENFWNNLPFELTNAQKKAVREIFQDLAKEKPMNRLLEGDVGSGKTVVAAIAMYTAYLNGFQSILMAPTEILAQQHHNTISNLLSSFGVNVDLITASSKYYVSSSKYNKKKKIHNTKYIIQNTNILVGTHALLSEKIKFDKLGLVVIDEQHRFGVEQRAVIRKKGNNPHILTMTATPIPRTIALTMYGDLDLSYLDELPKGRKKIKTWLVPKQKRESAYKWIEKEIKENKTQAFIICPFIEESENMTTVKAATKEFERLQKEVFKNLKLGLLHGKQKPKEKDKVLSDFRDKKFDILVATPVVEVGIDIPNAAIILIEGADRFGLAQLHQLRGRVGRGDKQSYCLLFTESVTSKTSQRLKAMETIHIGAELAEFDLKMRGPGEIFGTMQHGVAKLKIASFSDFELIQKTRKEAEKILPTISSYPNLINKLSGVESKTISPD